MQRHSPLGMEPQHPVDELDGIKRVAYVSLRRIPQPCAAWRAKPPEALAHEPETHRYKMVVEGVGEADAGALHDGEAGRING